MQQCFRRIDIPEKVRRFMKREKIVIAAAFAIIIAAVVAQGITRLHLVGFLFLIISISSWIDVRKDPEGRCFMIGRGGFCSSPKKKTVAIFCSVCTVIYLMILLCRMLLG